MPEPEISVSARIDAPTRRFLGRWWLGLAVCAVAVVAGCRQEIAGEDPELGASRGEVRLDLEGEVSSGAPVTVRIQADDPDGVAGGACFRIYRWEAGFGPFPDWIVDARSGERWRIAPDTDPYEYDQAIAQRCPATGVALPDELTLLLPRLDDGVYHLSYAWTTVRERPPGRPGEISEASYGFEIEGA